MMNGVLDDRPATTSSTANSREAAAQLAEALRMLDVFASVGAQRFDLTHINIDGEKRGFRKAQTLRQVMNSMPHLLASAPRRQNNVIIRPHGSTAQLVQLDDLDATALERVRPVAFLTLQTSPGNHQAWVAVSAPPADFARRLRKGTNADVTPPAPRASPARSITNASTSRTSPSSPSKRPPPAAS
jgi:hypothetical protein